MLITKEIEIPQITKVYDLLSKRKDGTVTPQAPVIVSGCNLKLKASVNSRFCLIQVIDFIRVIEFPFVYKHSNEQAILHLPYLEPGEYFLSIVIKESGGKNSVYILPDLWVVRR